MGQKLNVGALALSFGILWGLSVLVLGWIAMGGWGVRWVEVLSSLYIGYRATVVGAIIGAIWAFFDGLIGGFLIAVFYNAFLPKNPRP
jgi:hypothetical protein